MLYLSGKISNPDPEVQKENLKRFYEVEAQMDEPCFNPAKLESVGWTWEQYLARDLLWIIQNRPKMYMMIGWEDSLGARLEHEMAKLLHLDIEYEVDNSNGQELDQW